MQAELQKFADQWIAESRDGEPQPGGSPIINVKPSEPATIRQIFEFPCPSLEVAIQNLDRRLQQAETLRRITADRAGLKNPLVIRKEQRVAITEGKGKLIIDEMLFDLATAHPIWKELAGALNS